MQVDGAAVSWEGPVRRDRRADAERLRTAHPTLTVSDPVWEQRPDGGTWRWEAALAGGPTFRSEVTLAIGESTAAGTGAPSPAPALGRILATIDALSYWKASASPVLRVEFPLPGRGEWWQRLVAGSMAEYLWANGLDPDWLPALESAGADTLAVPAHGDGDVVLLLHSGGKDSIAAGHLLAAAGHRVRTVTYQPNADALAVVAASAPPAGWAGPGTTVHRVLDRQLLDLNDTGYLNGHTPFSGWLAVAGLAVAELVGAERVAAGNGASDDEPNITGTWRDQPWPVNHQWSKSAAFEAAWAEIGGPGRRYASPLRPTLELAVVAGIVATAPPGADRALSCNRAAKAGRPGAWCGRCPKCAWAAVAIGALAGADAVVARLGADPLDDADNAELVAAMCGRRGPIPFECAGLPMEVRACIRAVIADRVPETVAAFAALAPGDLDDGDEPPTVADLVGRLGPAPLLSAPEHAAVEQWIAAALAPLR